MEYSIYEKTYECVKDADTSTLFVNKVAELLKAEPDRAFTCQELGSIIWGESYKRVPEKTFEDRHHNYIAAKCTGTLRQIITHFKDNGYVIKTEEQTTEPVVNENGLVVTREVWVESDIPEKPYIIMTDKLGRTAEVCNPWYVPGDCGHYEAQPVCKTIVRYQWAGKGE